MAHHQDALSLEVLKENKKWLKDLSKRILKVDSFGSGYSDLRWLMDNKDKILRNKKLIDILG